jgi:hypothetical protein
MEKEINELACFYLNEKEKIKFLRFGNLKNSIFLIHNGSVIQNL